MKKLIIGILIVGLFIQIFGAFACRDNSGNTVKPSTIVVVAQVFAIEPVAAKAFVDITEVLAIDKSLSSTTERAIYKGTKEVQSRFDVLREAIRSGAWDSLDSLKQKLDVGVQAFKDAVNSGTLGIKSEQTKIALINWAIVIQQSAENIGRLIVALKPLPDDLEKQSVLKKKTNQELSGIGIVAISAISTNAAIEVAELRRIIDTEVLYSRAKAKSDQLHSFLNGKIAS